MTEELDLQAYLQRIGYDGGLDPTVETLTALHRAHVLSIPFENLDILLGRPIRLDLASLQAKLVRDRRGGYCFEQNALFAAVLEHLAFDVTGLAARVTMGEERTTPRTHMILAVDIAGTRWLADVGFGGVGLLEPIALRDGTVAEQAGLTYALRRDGCVWVLSMRDPSLIQQSSHDTILSMTDLYEFSEDPQTAGDVEVANHFTSTHPDSVFRRTLTIQRSARDGRLVLRGDTLTRYTGGRAIDEPVAPERVRDVARELFGVELPVTPLISESHDG